MPGLDPTLTRPDMWFSRTAVKRSESPYTELIVEVRLFRRNRRKKLAKLVMELDLHIMGMELAIELDLHIIEMGLIALDLQIIRMGLAM